MKPYYHDPNSDITIYHGDCLDILPTLLPVDLVLTDPPYGIAKKWKGGQSRGWAKADSQKAVRNAWDDEKPDQRTIDLCVSKGRLVIVWGGNYFRLPESRCWLIWSKPERGFTLAEAELAWTNANNVVRVFDGKRSEPGRQHPTQKPVALFLWCLGQSWAKPARTILDPFLGSGTTLLAAKMLGRKAVGIELNEDYCEMAAKRLEEQFLPLEDSREPMPPEQLELYP